MWKSLNQFYSTFKHIHFLYLFILMVEICIQLFSLVRSHQFFGIKTRCRQLTQPWRIAFQMHVLTSSFVLLAGFTQFSRIYS